MFYMRVYYSQVHPLLIFKYTYFLYTRSTFSGFNYFFCFCTQSLLDLCLFLVIAPENYIVMDYEYAPSPFVLNYVSPYEKNFPFMLSLLSMFLCIMFSSYWGYVWFWFFKTTWEGLFVYRFFNRKWYFDYLINNDVTKTFLNVGFRVTYQLVDVFFQRIGPYASTIYVRRFFDFIVSIQDGNLTSYATWIIWSVVFVLWIYIMVLI